LQSDPNGLQGVAASLMLDALELVATDLEVGLIYFETGVSTENGGTLMSKEAAREKLKKLPPANGLTNMEPALEQALTLVSQAQSVQKKIVLITGGIPQTQQNRADSQQITSIPQGFTQKAKAAGIKVFVLGFSGNTDEAFLRQVATEEKYALTAANTMELLKSAKKLFFNSDNLIEIKSAEILSNQDTFEFEMPDGLDRARVTVLFENQQRYVDGDIEVSIQRQNATDCEFYSRITESLK